MCIHIYVDDSHPVVFTDDAINSMKTELLVHARKTIGLADSNAKITRLTDQMFNMAAYHDDDKISDVYIQNHQVTVQADEAVKNIKPTKQEESMSQLKKDFMRWADDRFEQQLGRPFSLPQSHRQGHQSRLRTGLT